MKKTFKYRIYGNRDTIGRAEQWLEFCRKLYNSMLEERINAYQQDHKSLSCYDQIKELPALKQQTPEYKQVGSQVLQDVVEKLDKSYQAFFRRVKAGENPGFPRFKGSDRYDSFTLKQAGWVLSGKCLIIKNIGCFKIKLSRPIEGTIKTVTIRRNMGKWFVCFSCDNVPERPLAKTGASVGIDMGCEKFLTTSDGETIANPRFVYQSEETLKRRQQVLARRHKGSHRRRKARLLVAKIHEKIYNQRRDFHFKTARALVQRYDHIFIEDLHTWKTFRVLNRSMRDVAWMGFFEVLTFKAEEAGKEVIKVPAKDTSQICSNCGVKVPKDLSVRTHNCPSCGLSMDRDLNAAHNILRLGQSLRLC